MSSAVGRLFWFQSDGPGVSRHDVSPSMDAAGVNTLVELVGDDAEVSVLHDDVAGDGGQDLLAVFIPAGKDSRGKRRTRPLFGTNPNPNPAGASLISLCGKRLTLNEAAFKITAFINKGLCIKQYCQFI